MKHSSCKFILHFDFYFFSNQQFSVQFNVLLTLIFCSLMASSQASVISVPPILQQFKDFQLDIKMKLNWTQEEWESYKLVRSDRYFFCKNVKFWFDRLAEVKDPRFLVLTTFSSGSIKRPTFKEIILAFKQQFGLNGLVGASQSSNANYCILFFSSQAIKLKAMKEFCVVQNSFIVHPGWLPQQPLVNFQVNWLPPDIPLSSIREELEIYTPIVSLKKELLDLGDGDLFPTGKVFGSFNSNTISSLHSLPHFLSFPPYKAHWVIYNRPPICFACKWVGHVAAKCPTPFCSFCKSLLPRNHQCCKPSAVVVSSNSTVRSTFLDDPPSLLKSPVSVPQISSSSGTAVSGEDQDTVALQNFWSQNNSFLPSQSKPCKISSGLEHFLSSDSDEGSLSSLNLDPCVHSLIQDNFNNTILEKPNTLGNPKAFPFKIKKEEPLKFSFTSPPLPAWCPPKGAMSLHMDFAGSLPRTYSKKKNPKKK